MKKIIMFVLAVGMTGSVYAAIWDSAFGVNAEDGGYSETHQDTLSAPTAVGSADTGGGLFETLLNSESDSFDRLEDGE